ncbi:hypothetical protein MLD38_030663 [Melastoma candidum]|uniref:Uncharacterized protein n=1 Tax=Melastoma candidum TaxID=119954 RepID=A0ACB9MP87_9MYRT|nr:hypothetical protein MLD38_030663 [Melastoma candidum]
MSVNDTTPSSNPWSSSSTTQTRWTCFAIALSMTSASEDSSVQVTGSLGRGPSPEGGYRGLFEIFSVKSSAEIGSHVFSVERWQPLRSVAENVPRIFLPRP